MRVGRTLTVLALVVAGCGSAQPTPSASRLGVAGSPPAVALGPSISPTVASSSPSRSVAATAAATTDALQAVRHPIEELRSTRLEAEIPLLGYPDWQTSTAGAVWIATNVENVERIDTKTNSVTGHAAIPGACLSLASGYGSVWSPTRNSPSEVDRVDPKTGKVVARIPVPGFPDDGEGQLVAAYGSVWVPTMPPGSLTRIDPKTNRLAETIDLGGNPVAVVAAADHLWVTDNQNSAVLELDQAGKLVRTIAVSPLPRFIAAGEGGVWVLGQGKGDVTRIDPPTGTVVATIPIEVNGTGGCIATGGGSVWVTMFHTPITRIDPKTNRVSEQYTGDGGDCIGFCAGSIWLSNNALGSVWRFRP